MRVELRALKPNPFRNFKVDPINDDLVEVLSASIKENPAGFWGGVVARKHNGSIELAFGHHRIRAAIKAGIREDEIKVVSEISDAEMIRMYANENATQRGNHGTAIAGSVASAIKFLLKALFTGNVGGFQFTGNVGGFHPRSTRSLEVLQGQVVTERGLGWDIILEFLADIPGVNQNSVKQQLANLKTSGDYDEIVAAVKDEIEEEHKEELKRLARLEEEQRKLAEAAILAAQRAKEEENRRKEAARAARAAKEEADKRRAEKEEADAKLAAERAKVEAETGYEVCSPQLAAVRAKVPAKIASLVGTKRKQLAYLMQSADWDNLPPHERAVAETIYDDIEQFSIETVSRADFISKKLSKLEHRLRMAVDAGSLRPRNGGLKQLLSPDAPDFDDSGT